jgi:hypothetical protein
MSDEVNRRVDAICSDLGLAAPPRVATSNGAHDRSAIDRVVRAARELLGKGAP